MRGANYCTSKTVLPTTVSRHQSAADMTNDQKYQINTKYQIPTRESRIVFVITVFQEALSSFTLSLADQGGGFVVVSLRHVRNK